MLTTNANFDTLHALQYKQPLYHVQFDGIDYAFVNIPTADSANQRAYIQKISGHNQTIKPEYGRSSIGGMNIQLLNSGNEVLALLASDGYQMDRKKVTVKAGYVGMDESDLITIATHWVTGIKAINDNLVFDFKIEDPQKWMQRNIFRTASDSSVLTLQGNPINILLSILMSSGTPGTNGIHDYLDEENGLGLDSTSVNVSRLEDMRDSYFPGDSHYMKFLIKDKEKAKDFIEKQICQPLGVYPAIDGQGRFYIIPYRPPYDKVGTQSFSEQENIIGIPQWDLNLNSKINEIEFHIDENDGDYTEYDYSDGTSINNRGAGVSPLKIKSDGLRTDLSPGSLPGRALDIIDKRKKAIFGRWSNPPPIKLKLETFFWGWLTEAGDIVSVTHSKVPDPINGTMGISDVYMEVVSRSINWDKGSVSIDLLDTGFGKDTYGIIGASGHKIGSVKIAP
jgi:hypothetical protein